VKVLQGGIQIHVLDYSEFGEEALCDREGVSSNVLKRLGLTGQTNSHCTMFSRS